jgi:formylglycine-generating enzyme required for sulfatase activity
VLALLVGAIVLFSRTPHGSEKEPLAKTEQDKGDKDKNPGIVKQQDKQLAAKVIGRYKLAFREEGRDHKGETRWEFTEDRAIENGRDKGTWRIEGGKIILTYSQHHYGQVVLEFQDDNTLVGKHQQKNGQIFNWVLTREGSAKTGKLAPTFTNSLGMEFVLVPKGRSWLGGGGGKPGDKEVEIAHDFYLGKYEVTQEQWQKITGNNPSYCARGGHGKDAVKDIADAELKQFPVESVSWEEAQLFVKELNRREKDSGWVYRLPREAEWEYACRGGPTDDKAESTFDFYFEKSMNFLLPDQANFDHDKALKRTCRVGSYRPNRLGLHDMHGNVREWCQDLTSRFNVKEDVGVVLGGNWGQPSAFCRAAHRDGLFSSYRDATLGLRVARIAVGKEPVAAPPPAAKKTTALPPAFKNNLGMEFVLVDVKEDFYLGKYEVTQEECGPACGPGARRQVDTLLKMP